MVEGDPGFQPDNGGSLRFIAAGCSDRRGVTSDRARSCGWVNGEAHQLEAARGRNWKTLENRISMEAGEAERGRRLPQMLLRADRTVLVGWLGGAQ
jgi:hypothetical protein